MKREGDRGNRGSSQKDPVHTPPSLDDSEMYEEPGAAKKTRPNRHHQSPPQIKFIAQEMVDILKRSGYMKSGKFNRGACS
jgi:hypothetical protein